MKSSEKTFDTILNGKITITQPKDGFRFGFDSVFLAAFVNGYIKKNITRIVGFGYGFLCVSWHGLSVTSQRVACSFACLQAHIFPFSPPSPKTHLISPKTPKTTKTKTLRKKTHMIHP